MIIKRKPYKRYPKEFKLEAVRLMRETDKPASQVAVELGIRRNQLYKWAEQLERAGEMAFKGAGRPKKEDQAEVTTLKQENERLREEVEILKKGGSVLRARAEVKYAFIKANRKQHKVTRMLWVLGASPSGYYAWLDRPESPRIKSNRALTAKIVTFHKTSREIYGSPRIHKDLRDLGERVGENRVARLMRENGIQSKMSKKFVITTDSKNTLKPAPDHLRRRFQTSHPNQAWVSDTTFIRTRQGWLYLAVVLDLFSRSVIGWAMGNSNDSALVQDALTMALWRRGKLKQIIVHSDRGATYASGAYQQMLKDHQLICSMSRKGECLDNAVAESFFGTLKTELVDHEDYHTKASAKQSLFEYIEVFYNRRRRHSYLGYVSPEEYERQIASH